MDGREAPDAAPAGDPPPATDAILGANPFLGLTPDQVGRAIGRWAAALGRHPAILAADALDLWAQQLRILAGVSALAPDPRDRRFGDPAWKRPAWKRVAQSYLATRDAVLRSVDEIGLDDKSRDRAVFALTQVTEAAAPTNFLLLNPTAMARARQTRAASLAAGFRHWVDDVLHNGGMPSQVDTRPFRVGETLAVTGGAVVHRTELFELIQYRPTTTRTCSLPTVVVPPQINRYYFLDLAPGRSFVEYAVGRGIPTFMMSWRNPGPAQRAWGLDDYAAATIEAFQVARDVMRSEQVNVISVCAGGMTVSAVLAHLARTGDRLVNAAGLGVSLMDVEVRSNLNVFMSDATVRSALAESRRKGILDGRSLARMFAFMRPNDLVWNYWVSNYLLGEDPPAFDVLAWNADPTNLPAALHADFLRMWQVNALVRPGAMSVLGTPVDLSRVDIDVYAMGALTDHLVPWQSAYAATQTFGGKVRFVLSNSGHIQALVNPPGNPKATYYCNDHNPPSPEAWLEGATKAAGTWWEDWADWTLSRAGELRPRARRLGNAAHPPIEPAPGRYVHE
ncbi:MAG: PHA/PHB synthase family protein [Acidimicrobiales bacterium]